MPFTSVSDIPETLREALAMHEAFRRLGIPAKDIFVSFASGKTKKVDMLIVAVQEGKMFQVQVGPAVDGWTDAVHFWKETTDEIREEIWTGSRTVQASAQLLLMLVSHGFKVPGSGLEARSSKLEAPTKLP